MKNIRYLITVAFISFLFFSCEKEGTTVTKVINVKMNMNETYTHAIPGAGDEDDAMQITQQAAHSMKSEINQSGNSVILNYTPALNYTGTDEVKIGSVEGRTKGHAHGGCSGHHHEDRVIYDFRITINGNVK